MGVSWGSRGLGDHPHAGAHLWALRAAAQAQQGLVLWRPPGLQPRAARAPQDLQVRIPQTRPALVQHL